MIQTQIRLPLAAALKVVLQGIKVRFGRSVVTVMGVALGIAFLMSILAGQVVKSGVAEEQALRNEVTRMFNFFVAEAGLPKGMVLGLVELGALSPVEQRFLDKVKAAGPEAVQRGDAAGEGATAVLVIGEGMVDPARVTSAAKGARHRIIFATRTSHRVSSIGGIQATVLERQLRDDEIAKMEEEERKSRFRNVWIVVISLFVTVIGITNSMLMSVTERFREIGTMKCLGALSAFVRQMFLIESSIVGLVGALAGAVIGAMFSIVAYAFTYGLQLVLESLDPLRLATYFVLCTVIGIVLAVVAALYPARIAARMLPAHALRSEI